MRAKPPPPIGYAKVHAAIDASQGRRPTREENREMIVWAGRTMAAWSCDGCGLPLGLGNEVVKVTGRQRFAVERFHSPACVPDLRTRPGDALCERRTDEELA